MLMLNKNIIRIESPRPIMAVFVTQKFLRESRE